jgi:septal ring factor EnvC (AmiA/AmiB activator)
MRPGSYISMNSDAARALHNAPMTEVGGQRVRRMQPGTYFVMADDDSAQVRAAMAGNEMGAIDVGGLIGQIGETATGLFTTGWGAYQQYEQQQAEADARREEARLARERAEAERQAAETAAERAHAQRMAEIAAETEALARQAEARAAAAREASIAPAAAPAAGMPGWAIALLAVGGMGAVGVIVYLLTRKKD